MLTVSLASQLIPNNSTCSVNGILATQQRKDYSLFGVPLDGRTWNADKYRYTGINGQEADLELGTGVSTAEYWEYDGKLGRRWNIDPKTLPSVSSYSCFLDNPIFYVDIHGDKVDPNALSEEERTTLKTDIEKKTGFTIKEVSDDNGVLSWEIDKSVKVNKEGTSKTARKMFKYAVTSSEIITLEGSSSADKREATTIGNRVNFNFAEIAKNLSNSVNVNSTTLGYAMVFFHEIGHTNLYARRDDNGNIIATVEDPKDLYTNSSIDKNTNKIRKELGASYGQRMFYTAVIKSESQYTVGDRTYQLAYVAFNKATYEFLKNNKGKAIPPEDSKYSYVKYIIEK